MLIEHLCKNVALQHVLAKSEYKSQQTEVTFLYALPLL